jgi:hypothetical protein
METDELKQTVADAVSEESEVESLDLRERVKAATVAALRDGKISISELRDIGRSLAEGVTQGLGQRKTAVGEGLSQAVSGIGQAYGEVSERIGLTLRESMDRNRNFKSEDLSEPLERLKCLEEEFRATMKELADKSGRHVKGEWGEVSEHFSKVGSDVGSRMRDGLESLYNRLHGEAREAKSAVKDALGEGGSRVADAASGLFAGVSDALKKPPPPTADT